MPKCPNGHQSDTDDWCEVCGIRMAAPASPYGSRPPSSASSSSSGPSSRPPVSPSPPGVGAGGYDAGYEAEPAAIASVCPQCGTPREGAALFCEVCRFNFRTHSPTIAPGDRGRPGVPPAHPGPAPAGPVDPVGAGSVPAGPVPTAPVPTAPGLPPFERYETQLSRPSQVNRPAEPVPVESVTSGSGDFLLEPPSGRSPAPGGAGARPGTEAHVPPGAAAASGPVRAPGPDVAAGPVGRVGAVTPGVPASPGFGPAPGAGHGTGASAQGGAAGPAGPVSRSGWVAVIAPDRAYFTAMMARSGPDAEGLYFPAFAPELRLPLTGEQVTVGRRRQGTGETPDIDLSRAPEDPGVSHRHAVLVRRPDGGWSVVDQDSTNGTTVNLAEDTIRPYTPVPLEEGDRVHVGAWTTITVQRA